MGARPLNRLLALGAIGLAALGGVVAYVLIQRGNHHAAPPTTTATTETTRAPRKTKTTSTVPDLAGLNEAEAAGALGKAGLLASLFFVPARDPLGTVEAQGRRPGTPLPVRSRVRVNVSAGPGGKPRETMPFVIGKTLDDALAVVGGAHLRVIYLRYPVRSKAQAGKVVQQTPLPGAHAPENAQVIVYVGYQPRRSSSSAGSRDAVEIPTMASPRPAETRAITSASM